MKVLFIMLSIFSSLLFNCFIFSENNISIKEYKEIPKWVNDYEKQKSYTCKFFGDGTINEVINNVNRTKINVINNDNYILNIYHDNKLIKQLLSSEEGFIHINWSKNGKYFSLLNLTYVGDWVYNGDLYVYQIINEKMKPILFEKDTRAGAAGFSNNNKYVAYGFNNKLVLYEIDTKRKKVLNVPSDINGSISLVAWNENDNEIFINYVVSNSAKYFLISL